MIGGIDIVVDGTPDLDLLLRIAAERWPEAVVVDALTDAFAAPIAEALEVGVPTGEFFIYKTEESRGSWDFEGETEENADELLHVIQSDNSGLSFVVGSLKGDTFRIVQEYRGKGAVSNEVVLALHELYDRHVEIPLDVEDAYIIGVWNADFAEDAALEGGGGHPLWDVPWNILRFDAFRAVRQSLDREDFKDRWPAEGSCRIAYNTFIVSAPVFLRIRWGDGHPKTESGIEMLPHETDFLWCVHCGQSVTGSPKDCPTRRLRALAEARDPEEIEGHRQAVAAWHPSGKL